MRGRNQGSSIQNSAKWTAHCSSRLAQLFMPHSPECPRTNRKRVKFILLWPQPKPVAQPSPHPCCCNADQPDATVSFEAAFLVSVECAQYLRVCFLRWSLTEGDESLFLSNSLNLAPPSMTCLFHRCMHGHRYVVSSNFSRFSS
jgi:hypothetical protein